MADGHVKVYITPPLKGRGIHEPLDLESYVRWAMSGFDDSSLPRSHRLVTTSPTRSPTRSPDREGAPTTTAAATSEWVSKVDLVRCQLGLRGGKRCAFVCYSGKNNLELAAQHLADSHPGLSYDEYKAAVHEQNTRLRYPPWYNYAMDRGLFSYSKESKLLKKKQRDAAAAVVKEDFSATPW